MGCEEMTYQNKDFDPETQYIAWNGDVREKPTRWNGDSDMEDIGFMSRGIRTVTGTTAPTNVKQGARPAAVTPGGPINYSPFGPQPVRKPVEEPQIKRAKKQR